MNLELRTVVHSMNKLDMIRRIHMAKAAGECGLYFGQLPILEYVEENDMCTQCSVAERMQVTAPSIATSVKRMQKTGLLEKSADDNDLRYNRLSITQKGRETARKCRASFNKINETLFMGFTKEEIEALYGYIQRMSNNMTDEELKGKTFFALAQKEKEINRKEKKEDIFND